MPSNNFNENGNQNIPKILWNPKLKSTKMHDFMEFVNKKYQLHIETYRELWEWSTENYSEFWEEFWIFSNVIYSEKYEEVVDKSKTIADIPEWFKGARLNYAENMLRFNDDRIALIGSGEGRTITKVTYKQLHKKVAQYAAALKTLGIKTGDRVVGYLPNCIEAVEAMLAVASIGAIWSSTSPDFGVNGVLDRFQQIQPKVIFSVEAVRYNGKVHSHLAKLREVAKGLHDLENVVVIPFVNQEDELDISDIPNSMTISTFLEHGECADRIEFKQLPFNHPLFIMYSSGTTGPPKCMVHSAGGTLIQHMKEHMLHGNMGRNDIILYYTTTGWMMWNWLVGALTTGATVVTYDGSPFQPVPTIIWDLVDSVGITILGTSAKCLDVMDEMGLKPRQTHNLATLHTVLSTGSPLAPHQYDFVYGDVKENVLLGSITGGTDIISCFISQNWTVPVHRGELQSANLGMAVCSYLEHEDSRGSLIYDEPGELVCLKPFPSMPTRFWNDKDGIMYKKAYFSKFSGIWSHGDFCIENSLTNGFVMLGRSDATLNPNGVRFGTSELYAIIESQFRKEIQDSLASAQRPGRNSDNKSERVILFVKMMPGYVLDNGFEGKIRRTIRTLLSPRHVPAVILQTEDIPYTISGKKVEIAVTRILNGMPVLHKSAFRNPDSLELYKNLPVLENY